MSHESIPGATSPAQGGSVKTIILKLTPQAAAVELALLKKLHKQPKKTKGKKAND